MVVSNHALASLNNNNNTTNININSLSTGSNFVGNSNTIFNNNSTSSTSSTHLGVPSSSSMMNPSGVLGSVGNSSGSTAVATAPPATDTAMPLTESLIVQIVQALSAIHSQATNNGVRQEATKGLDE